MVFDIDLFRRTLLAEASLVFPQILSDLGSEGIYSLALYCSGDSWIYLFPIASTYSGLQQMTQKYKGMEPYKTMPYEDIECTIKWSPCDSPHHRKYVDSMPETADLINQAADVLCEIEDDDEAETLHKTLEGSCLDVLQTLNRQGVFGKDFARRQLLVNLLQGDQSDEERLEHARLLNPPIVCDRFAEDCARARRLVF